VLTPLAGVVTTTLDQFVSGVVDAVPSLLSALVFLPIAYVGIRLLTGLLRASFERVYPSDQKLVVDLYVAVVTVFLWFGALLALFKILGLENVAASLGTATGFVALGVSYALSDMIADTVAGVYLLRDRDFEVGDTVTVGGTQGQVADIGLRKSRLDVGEDVLVLRNRDIEGKWTKVG
jgi:small-conductance mechanosensitive channel